MKPLTAVFIVFLLVFGGFTYWVVNHSGYLPYGHNPMQYMPNMHRSAVIKTQRASPLFEDSSGARTPPAGVVARSGLTGKAYDYTPSTSAEEVSKFKNPLPVTRETVERGQELYMNNCVVCHGERGLSNGYVVPPYPKPPLLVSEKIQGWADSQIYHVITVGQNTMMGYAKQVREEDRWKLIHFIRVLQLAYDPRPEDIEAFENVKAANK